MQNTSERYKMEIAQPSRKISGKITFPGLILDDTQIKNIEHSSALVHGEGFEIGTAPMGVIIIELIEDSSAPVMYDFEGQEGLVELGLMLPDESVEHIDIGLYTVKSAIKENNIIKIEALDRMHKAEKEYISDILYPATLLDILQSACDQVGIVLATTTFANADYVVPNEPVYEGVTCRRIFAQVAELAGGYAVMNRQGELEILTLGATPVRAITKDNYFEFKRNEAAAGKIDKLIVKVGDAAAEAGTGDNIYTVIDNMFVQNPSNVIGPIFNVLKDVSYTACDVNFQGDFSLDLGDRVSIDGHETYILDRKLKYTGGLREDYRAPAKSNIEKKSTGKGSLTLDIENVKTQIKVIDGEIKQTVERVENLVVGANNRLYDSQTEIPFGFNSGSGTIKLFRDQVHPYYKVTSSQSIDLFAAFPDSQFAESLEEMGEVTISLDVMVDVDRTVAIDGKDFDVKANRWTRIHVTKSFDDNTTKRFRVRNPFSRRWTRDISVGTKLIDSLSVDINTLHYRNLKVERGNMATDWTLTPEELEVNVNRYSSEIKQLADSISMMVRKDELSTEFMQNAESIVAAINTTDGVGRVKTVNATLDENGFTVENGAIIVKNASNVAIITADGLRVMYIFTSAGELNGWQKAGVWDEWDSVTKHMSTLNVYIPDDLITETAQLYVRSMPAYRTGDPNIPDGFYHPRNLKLYKGVIASDGFLDWPYGSEYWVMLGADGRTDITTDVWGSSWSPTGKGIKEKVGDVTAYLTPGESHNFIVETTDAATLANARYMGAMQLELVITGFLRG